MRSTLQETRKTISALYSRDIACLCLGLTLGLAPFLIMNYHFFESPLFSNYPSYDRAISGSAFNLYGNIESSFLRSGIHSSLAIASIFSITTVYRNAPSQRYHNYALVMLAMVCVISFCICIKVVVTPYYLDFISFFCLFHTQGLNNLKIMPLLKFNRSLIANAAESLTIVSLALLVSTHRATGVAREAELASDVKGDYIKVLRSSALWTHEEGGYLYYHYKIPSLRHSRFRNKELAREISISLESQNVRQFFEGDEKNFEYLGISDLASLSPLKSHIDHTVIREIVWDTKN